MNNENNNQNYNNQQVNNGQPVNNGQVVNNGQPANNGQVVNTNNQSMGMMNNQPMGMMNSQNLMPNQNQKNNKTLIFMIIGAVALVIIAAVVLINLSSSSKSKGNTINDFDNNGSNNQEEISNDTNHDDSYSSTDATTYKGFSIPKQRGYQYDVDTDGNLAIQSTTFATILSITYGNMTDAENLKDKIVEQYVAAGINASNAKTANYNGKEVMTIELDDNAGTKVLWYMMEAGSGYLFYGIALNPNYSINYENIETTVSLLANAKYTGEYKSTTDEMKAIKIRTLFE